MTTVPLARVAKVIRSKNAGPFELTLDVIFDDPAVYQAIKEADLFTPAAIAACYRIPRERVRSVVHYDPALAIKATLVRPLPSGAIGDTDVYGAQQHVPLMEMAIPTAVLARPPAEARTPSVPAGAR